MFVEAREWRVREVYRLEAVSGKSVIEHPEAKRMLADIRSGHISGLVFSKIARLARNTKELLEFADIFKAAGADMISLQEAIDTSSPAGRLFFTIIAAMAQWEREEIASRVAASIPIRAKLGLPTGGSAPYGYRWHKKKLEKDETEGPVRALIYELFVEHKRKKAVARILNERGYRTRNGSKFSDTTVERLIRDTTARGIHRRNYTKTTDSSKAWELKPQDEWIENPCDPLVSEELWDKANAILDGRKAKIKKPSREHVHLFSGFAHCVCGTPMYAEGATRKYVCRGCRSKIPHTDLEAVFRDQLSQFLTSPAEIAAHLEAANVAMQEKEQLIVAAEVELKKIESDDERLYQLYLSDKLSIEAFGKKHQPLEDRKKQLEDELPRLQAQLDVMRISSVGEHAAISEATSLHEHWNRFSDIEKRQLVETITDKIIIGNGEVVIDLLFAPTGAGKDGPKATRPHGFIAATNCTRAG
jgi:site-specific DNA recombinase